MLIKLAKCTRAKTKEARKAAKARKVVGSLFGYNAASMAARTPKAKERKAARARKARRAKASMGVVAKAKAAIATHAVFVDNKDTVEVNAQQSSDGDATEPG